MSTLPVNILETLDQNASAKSIQRGKEYLANHLVGTLIRRGNKIEADVIGSAPHPYRVRVEFDDINVSNATCSCPFKGWCKHIVAVLLAYAEQPGQIETRPPLDKNLAMLDRAQLQALLLELADRIPRMTDLIEAALPVALSLTPAESREYHHSSVAVNTLSIRQSVQNAIFKGIRWVQYEQDEEDYGSIGAIIEMAEQAQNHLNNSDYQTALAILDAVTGEFCKHWKTLEDRGEETSLFFDETLPIWTEALLDPDMTMADREYWANRLATWAHKLDPWVSNNLLALQTIVQTGWDDPDLINVLHDKNVLKDRNIVEDLWTDTSSPSPYALQETLARLRILKRTGQHESYLNLAKAEHLYKLYALYLLELGRIQESIDIGLKLPLSSTDSLELAEALYQHGETDAAINVAEHRLRCLELVEQPDPIPISGHQDTPITMRSIELYGYPPFARAKSRLASWLCEHAIEQGKTSQALAAAIIAFQNTPGLSEYQRVEKLAGNEHWPKKRQLLLNFLRKDVHTSADTRVDIFLYENLIDDAIQSFDIRYISNRLLSRVMDAAINQQPEWVIQKSRQQAESIMNQSRSSRYNEAINWLEKTRQAYQVLGQEQSWQHYLGTLHEKHYRKYKLKPMLEML